MKPLKKAIIVAASIAGIGLGVFALLALDESIRSSGSLTEGTMVALKRRILLYAHSHNQLPRTLSELPVIQGYVDSIRDEWGRPIIYEVLPSGDVRLTSLGCDGKIGGSDKDADMMTTFSPRNAEGTWRDEFGDWSHAPR